MLAECRTLNGCETGDAKITKGYLLPARHVIHAVGPIWYGGNRGEDEQLASCYRRAIELCQENGLESVAFPAISTGVFRFPAERAAKIAVTTTVKALPSAPSLTRVIFCCFSGAAASCMRRLWRSVWQPLCRLTGDSYTPREFREGSNEFS